MIYLDYNATTPLDRRVVDAMLPYLYEHFGNPSSGHACGRLPRRAIEEARGEVASLIGARPAEVVWTSGGTEANNMALKGVAALHPKGSHLVISAIEHPAIIEPCRWLESQGYALSIVPVDQQGIVDLEALRSALRPETILISVMLANNEVGTIQPLQEISVMARERGILLHTDAAQAVGKMAVDVEALGVDMLTLAGHKLYAPKGVGALYIRRGTKIAKWLHGAGHEAGRRAGTENTASIVGMGVAARLAKEEGEGEFQRIRIQRDRLDALLRDALGERLRRHGDPVRSLCNTLNLGFLGLQGWQLAKELGDQLAFSTASACHGASPAPSHVLQAMQIDPASARGAIRLSLGRLTKEEDIPEAARLLIEKAESLYARSKRLG